MNEFIIGCEYDFDEGWMPEEYREEIVRCRDCKWANPDQSDHEYREYYRCNMWIADVGANGFCSRGLLRKGGDAE